MVSDASGVRWLPPMPELLQRARFRVHGKRADCIHCEGHSRGTVAFTREVAYCHRCKWRANTVALARDLGLLNSDSPTARAFREETQKWAKLDSDVKPFEAWREAKIREVSDRYRVLSKAAVRASDVLSQFPDCNEAWDALARFCHNEAQMSAAFDWLMFTKVSAWLEEDSTPVEVFEAWRSHAA